MQVLVLSQSLIVAALVLFPGKNSYMYRYACSVKIIVTFQRRLDIACFPDYIKKAGSSLPQTPR